MPDTFIDDVDEETNVSLNLGSWREGEREGEKGGEVAREEGVHLSLNEFGLDEDCAS